MATWRTRTGNDATTGIYWERLDGGGQPVLWIHGGGATGACFRGDLDGEHGWADALAGAGFDCWVTDWPGCGRSGLVDPLDVGYREVVDAYLSLLRSTIARPAIVVCHSMGGAITWQLVEHQPDLVAGVISVAGAYPANTPPTSTIHADDGRVVRATFDETGLELVIDRSRSYHYGDAYLDLHTYGTSTRLDRARRAEVAARFSGMPPKMVLQRTGIEPGFPPVRATSSFQGMPIRLLAGPEDAAHSRKIEERTVALLRSWGADASLIWLADRGIEGNGHFLFWEDNAATIAKILTELATGISRA